MDFEQGVRIGEMRLGPVAASIAFILIVSVIFLVLPQIDIWFTRLFYDPEIGFPAKRIPILRGLRELNTIVITVVATALVLSIIIKLATPDRPSPIRPQVSLFILVTLLAGTVLVVNGIFKTFSGRPRPQGVDLFGGDVPFVPVWHFGGECPRNCSFVSGEGSSAFWIFAIWMAAPPEVRRRTFVPAVVYVGAVSLNRIAFGAHFLSDVLMSWGLMALIIALAWRYLVVRPPAWLSDERQEARWTRAGLAIRGAVSSLFARR